MTKKGIDTMFVHYGIRKEDLQVIEALCQEHQLEYDWVSEYLLKVFHDKKVENQDMDDLIVERIINSALQRIR